MNADSHKKANWNMAPDLRFLLGWQLFVIPIGIVTTMFILSLNKVSRGDLTLLWTALGLGLFGLTLLFVARLPLYRKHNYFSIGPAGLPARNRKLYWISYGFIGTCIVLLISILLTLSWE